MAEDGPVGIVMKNAYQEISCLFYFYKQLENMKVSLEF